MSTPDFPYSMSLQEGVISANLNSSMLLNFLLGIYTMVYAGTMYLYMSKKTANMNRHIVLSAISVQYILCISDFVLQWYYIDWVVVINGDTRESIFISTLEGGPQWATAFNEFLFYSLFIVSDGLLIWRCHQVWGRSFRVISVPLILFVAEFGLFVSMTVLRALFGMLTNEATANLINNISSALVFTSLGTTVTTTFLIGYKIYSATRLNDRPPSKRLFNRIVVVIVESAAAYSLVLLLDAIIMVVPSFAVLGSTWFQSQYYVEAVLTVVSGLAPTVLVARIALTNANNIVAPTIISGLQFEAQHGSGGSGNATRGEVNTSIHADDVGLAPMGEVKESNIDGTYGGYQV